MHHQPKNHFGDGSCLDQFVDQLGTNLGRFLNGTIWQQKSAYEQSITKDKTNPAVIPMPVFCIMHHQPRRSGFTQSCPKNQCFGNLSCGPQRYEPTGDLRGRSGLPSMVGYYGFLQGEKQVRIVCLVLDGKSYPSHDKRGGRAA